MNLLDGRKVADELLTSLTGEVRSLSERGVTPKLAVVLVGDNPASASYVRSKRKACERIGIEYEHVAMPESATTEEVMAQVEALDARDDVHGILVQLPLPAHVEEPLVIRAIQPAKDVDGFHAYNLAQQRV